MNAKRWPGQCCAMSAMRRKRQTLCRTSPCSAPPDSAWPMNIPLLDDPGTGLNPALHSALAQIAGKGADRMIVLFADLPRLTTQDVQLLAAAPPGTIAIAPDRHGTGTNALSLPLPEAKAFTFAFGADSYALHHAEAERLGLPVEIDPQSGSRAGRGRARGSGGCGGFDRPGKIRRRSDGKWMPAISTLADM